MSVLRKSATVCFNPVLHKAFRVKAAETSRSVSKMIRGAIQEDLAKDVDDLADFETCKHEPVLAFGDFVREPNRNGRM